MFEMQALKQEHDRSSKYQRDTVVKPYFYASLTVWYDSPGMTKQSWYDLLRELYKKTLSLVQMEEVLALALSQQVLDPGHVMRDPWPWKPQYKDP